MNLFKNLNIAGKLRRMILLTSGFALLLSSLAYLSIEFVSYRQVLVERAEVLAEFISTNSSAALTFGDAEDIFDLDLRYKIQLVPNAVGFAGYRWLSFDSDEGSDMGWVDSGKRV